MKKKERALVVVGKVLAPSSQKKLYKVRSYCNDPLALSLYNPIILEGCDWPVKIVIERAARDSILLAKITTKKNQDSKIDFSGKYLFADRQSFCSFDKNEYYISDLYGCKMYDLEHRLYGTVKAVHNFGAGDILEIYRQDGSYEMKLFSEENFPEVGISLKKIVSQL